MEKSKHQEDWKVGDVTVSDHAVIRYLEKRYSLDSRAIREEMLAEGRLQMIQKMRTCKLPILGTARLVVKDGCVTTVS